MNIDISQITDVLLSGDGWRKVARFGLNPWPSAPYTNAPGFWMQEADGTMTYGPLSSILAVRTPRLASGSAAGFDLKIGLPEKATARQS